MNIRREYIKEDLETDISWLEGFGISKVIAEDFIRGLLNRQWKEELK